MRARDAIVFVLECVFVLVAYQFIGVLLLATHPLTRLLLNHFPPIHPSLIFHIRSFVRAVEEALTAVAKQWLASTPINQERGMAALETIAMIAHTAVVDPTRVEHFGWASPPLRILAAVAYMLTALGRQPTMSLLHYAASSLGASLLGTRRTNATRHMLGVVARGLRLTAPLCGPGEAGAPFADDAAARSLGFNAYLLAALDDTATDSDLLYRVQTLTLVSDSAHDPQHPLVSSVGGETPTASTITSAEEAFLWAGGAAAVALAVLTGDAKVTHRLVQGWWAHASPTPELPFRPYSSAPARGDPRPLWLPILSYQWDASARSSGSSGADAAAAAGGMSLAHVLCAGAVAPLLLAPEDCVTWGPDASAVHLDVSSVDPAAALRDIRGVPRWNLECFTASHVAGEVARSLEHRVTRGAPTPAARRGGCATHPLHTPLGFVAMVDALSVEGAPPLLLGTTRGGLTPLGMFLHDTTISFDAPNAPVEVGAANSPREMRVCARSPAATWAAIMGSVAVSAAVHHFTSTHLQRLTSSASSSSPSSSSSTSSSSSSAAPETLAGFIDGALRAQLSQEGEERRALLLLHTCKSGVANTLASPADAQQPFIRVEPPCPSTSTRRGSHYGMGAGTLVSAALSRLPPPSLLAAASLCGVLAAGGGGLGKAVASICDAIGFANMIESFDGSFLDGRGGEGLYSSLAAYSVATLLEPPCTDSDSPGSACSLCAGNKQLPPPPSLHKLLQYEVGVLVAGVLSSRLLTANAVFARHGKLVYQLFSTTLCRYIRTLDATFDLNITASISALVGALGRAPAVPDTIWGDGSGGGSQRVTEPGR